MRTSWNKNLKGYTNKGSFKKGQVPHNKGVPMSSEQKEKLSKFKKGKPSWNKGKTGYGGWKLSEETKNKMRVASTGRKMPQPAIEKLRQYRGEKASGWKGGLWDNPYPNDWNETLRESIRERDNFTCDICGIHQDELNGWNKKLDVHHIDYNKDNLNPSNLISLCKKCHGKTNHHREYWIKYFSTNITQ